MTELTCDLRKNLADFKKICAKLNNDEYSNKELSLVLKNLKQSNDFLKENDKKYIEQIKTLRQICYDQEKAILTLYEHERKNEFLIQENINLKSIVQNLKDEINDMKIKNKDQILEYMYKHKMELEEKDKIYNKREYELKEKIEVLQASFDLEIYEKDNENNNVRLNYEEQIKKAIDKEQKLKDEIFKLNNQLSSNTAVLQKKILELEQKLKSAERGKPLYNTNQGNFISANNILRNHTNNPISHNNISINMRNISQNIESNTAKKFQFRKTNRNELVEKKLLSETFDPFEMSKQLNISQSLQQNASSTNQSNSSVPDVIYNISAENSENVCNPAQNVEVKVDESSENSFTDKQKNDKIQIKKRRLFNPKDMDYLS